MRRSTIAALLLAAAGLVASACSSPLAPTTQKKAECSVTTGGQICMK
jgi:hypothetical protein